MSLNRPHPFAFVLLVSLANAALLPLEARAWGPLGHRIIAETASILSLKSTSTFTDSETVRWWGKILDRQRFELGYYSFLPDSVFRQQSSRRESPTHYFDVDLVLDKKISEITDTAETFKKLLEKTPADFSRFPEKLKVAGTVPWRLQQFFDLAMAEIKPVKIVKGGYQPGNSDPEGASKINQTLFLLGVMAHYTGDSTMPYHTTQDYNGWETGQGGIHFYFEANCVNAQEPGLSTDVLKLAQEKKSEWLKQWKANELTPFELDLKVLLESSTLIPEIRQTDMKKVRLKPSHQETNTFAVRKEAALGCKPFRKVLVEQLAKGAVLTAHLWERIYLSADARKIDVSQAQELQFSDLKNNPAYIDPN
jgi:hypothetical protein